MSTLPHLAGHASRLAGAWLGAPRLRAFLDQPAALEARTATGNRLWLRARGSLGPAQWVAFTDAGQASWTPDHTGLWTLELGIETGPGQVALIPGKVREVIVEHPHFAAMRAYTLIPRVSGPLSGWPALLPEIKAMGFNAIWLLPITVMGDSQSPYSTSDPLRVDPAIGTFAEAEAFADACAAHGLALGVDLVFNHLAPDGAVAHEHPEWFATSGETDDGLARSGWSDGRNFHPWQDLVRLRADSQAPADRLDLLNFWAGYALQWTALAAKSGHPMARLDNAHSTSETLLHHVLPILRQTYPSLSILGEYFETHAGGAEAWVWRHGIERLLATPWMDPYASQKRRLLGFLDTMAATTASRHFVPLCSHDSPSAAEVYGGPAALLPRYAAIAFFSGGCTGVVQGTEWATPHKIEFIGPPGTYAQAQPMHEDLRQINAILEAQGPLPPTATRWLDSDHGAAICGLCNGIHGPLLIATNFDIAHDHVLNIDGQANLGWSPLLIRGATLDGSQLRLAPGGVGIWKLD